MTNFSRPKNDVLGMCYEFSRQSQVKLYIRNSRVFERTNVDLCYDFIYTYYKQWYQCLDVGGDDNNVITAWGNWEIQHNEEGYVRLAFLFSF